MLSIAIMGFAAGSVSLTRASKNADSTSAASGLAQERLEMLRSLPLGALQHTTGSYADASSVKADGTANGPYMRTWTVSQKDTPRAGLKTITVTVAWHDPLAHTTKMAAFVRCSRVPCP